MDATKVVTSRSWCSGSSWVLFALNAFFQSGLANGDWEEGRGEGRTEDGGDEEYEEEEG